jgi:hypothetical protein
VLRPRVATKLENAAIIELIGRENICREIVEAL